LALRLLARIVLLALAVFFICGSSLDRIGAFVAEIRRRLGLNRLGDRTLALQSRRRNMSLYGQLFCQGFVRSYSRFSTRGDTAPWSAPA
jgi:hypothetical protein